jgi:hypothetical protein
MGTDMVGQRVSGGRSHLHLPSNRQQEADHLSGDGGRHYHLGGHSHRDDERYAVS